MCGTLNFAAVVYSLCLNVEEESWSLEQSHFISIKQEAEEETGSDEEEESWTLEQPHFLTIKQEEEEETGSDEDMLEPISTVDVKEPNITSQKPFILINVNVNGGNKKSCMQYSALSEIMRKNRERVATYRANETTNQRQIRLQKDRERKAKQRMSEKSISEIYQQRLQEERERTARKRLHWTAEQRQENLKRARRQKRLKRLEQKISNLMVNMVVNKSFHKEFTCDICGYTCEIDTAFKEHYFTHFYSNKYFCNYCGESFSYQFDLTEHELVHTDWIKPFKCEHCISEHTTLESLSKHCRRKHRVSLQTTNFKCKICQETFTSRKALMVHSQTHPRIETANIKTPFLCDVCGKIVTTYQSFQNHYRIHTGEKPFVCKECGKSFTAYVGLHYHSRIHTGEKPYECTECGRAFGQRSSYVVHKRLHSGERPYGCTICEKNYVTSTLLKAHMKTHTNL